jgi:membrane protein implicated in regulation of membrane protease activity
MDVFLSIVFYLSLSVGFVMPLLLIVLKNCGHLTQGQFEAVVGLVGAHNMGAYFAGWMLLAILAAYLQRRMRKKKAEGLEAARASKAGRFTHEN